MFDERVYLFGSHDQEGGDSFCMLDYEGWSAPVDDLGAWESAGIIYSAKQDPSYSEKRPYMYAPDVVRGNDGRFYLYYCMAGWKGNGGYDGPISVATCDIPNGQYEYLGFVRHQDGNPFLDCITFDPAVINDNGVVRLYCGTNLFWGMEIKKWNRHLLAPMASGVYNRPKQEFLKESNPLGAYTFVLADDMLTVNGNAKRILPIASRKNGFKGHSFYEGASIRKVKDTYYFIYSSEKNHELCYATSKLPDTDFVYGGTLISNGDIGFQNRKDKQRLNITGTNHGSMECVNGQWYIFYHRLTHGSDYSRQACAEPIEISADGKIKQVEMSSCGLNNAPLVAEGVVPATKACNLTNGKMPHISNKKLDDLIPRITDQDGDHYITGLSSHAFAAYKWFQFSGEPLQFSVVTRGSGVGSLGVYLDAAFTKPLTTVPVQPTENWQSVSAQMIPSKGVSALYLHFEGTGNLDVLEFSFLKI